MLMGGFHLFRLPPDTPSVPLGHISSESSDFVTPLELSSREEEVPVCPLQIDDIPVAILKVLSPTETELKDKGKSDVLTKLLVLVQILWFVIQCIARGIQHLPLTELEVVTLAYTMLNFFIYIFWWDKPQNVGCPIRVYKASTAKHKKGGKEVDMWQTGSITGSVQKVLMYFAGEQDGYVDYSRESSLPMFWSGRQDPNDTATFLAPGGMSLVAMGFGAIHFIVWHSEFPSRTELILWRVACILLTTIPITPWIAIVAIWGTSELPQWMTITFLAILSLHPPLYIASRAATLLIASTALRSLPDAALIDVDWTAFIPHI
jgi:hypothetical protein